MSMLSPETHAQSPKRFACDRCRGHKLRCPREDQAGQSCARCLRADAPCITSNLRPLGRPARKITPGNSHGRERRPRKPVRGQSGTTGDEIDMLYDIDPTQISNDPFDAEKHHGSRRSDVPSEGQEVPHFFGFDPAILLGLSGFSDDFLEVGLSNGQSPEGVPSLNGTHIPSTSDAESAYAGTIHRSSSQNLDSDSLRAADPSKQPRKTMSSADAIQRLSVLIQSLSKQLDRLKTAPWSVTLVNIVCASQGQEAANSNPLGEVLQSTSEFVQILQTIAPKTSTDQLGSGFQSPNSDPTTLSSSGSNMYCSRVAANLNNAVQPLHISSSPFGQLHTPELRILPPSDHSKPDISTALVILTCYIQIIQIYNILFLRSISSLQPVRGLQLGGFPVQYGNLQIKILVQVIMHLLSHIERLLGTPAEYRLDPASGSSDGLFSSSELTALLRMAMSQKDDKESDGMGVGYIYSLRKIMKKIQRMLELNPFL
ncbi:uncharacterized protein N7446_001345 [Penicillium canescens]|uniref:Zn(2)-C6 fungal-type domain-containing protein n=1 Tax=Penicillium canescens TaxID=5083 RepID=A0AAD6N8S2_PENCN|nr:uncharacterized protein N7446_001345 [Penicillium canescens]KAJ6043149.1 hypothetical protein N7460_004504 [Penicillium canescens]KAJ6054624.1 hypothetical protein N7444_003722 [Penicillium canescens]KAJ6073568.1 hypothetical protein N7446_001345 [Penicillium canescens]